MKTKTLWILTSFVLLTALAGCSAVPLLGGAQPMPRQISASGSGQVFLTPDIAYISIGVESRSEIVGTALSRNNAQAKAVAGALEKLGVDPKDIQTSAFNVYPQIQYGPMGEPGKTEYVVNNTVFVTVRDLQKMGELLDAAVRAGANSIHGVSFDIQDKAEAISQARRLAIENARANAQEIAALAGVELVDLITVNTYTQSPPVPFYDAKGFGGMAAEMSAEVPFASGQMVLTVNADMTFSIR